jgi:hypothetical protein
MSLRGSRSVRYFKNGGHDEIACKTLFKKHVFPMFFRPLANGPDMVIQSDLAAAELFIVRLFYLLLNSNLESPQRRPSG